MNARTTLAKDHQYQNSGNIFIGRSQRRLDYNPHAVEYGHATLPTLSSHIIFLSILSARDDVLCTMIINSNEHIYLDRRPSVCHSAFRT